MEHVHPRGKGSVLGTVGWVIVGIGLLALFSGLVLRMNGYSFSFLPPGQWGLGTSFYDGNNVVGRPNCTYQGYVVIFVDISHPPPGCRR